MVRAAIYYSELLHVNITAHWVRDRYVRRQITDGKIRGLLWKRATSGHVLYATTCAATWTGTATGTCGIDGCRCPNASSSSEEAILHAFS